MMKQIVEKIYKSFKKYNLYPVFLINRVSNLKRRRKKRREVINKKELYIITKKNLIFNRINL